MNFAISDEERMLQKMVRDFARTEVAPSAAKRDEAGKFDGELFKKMSAHGLTGILSPESEGGSDADELSAVLALEALAGACASTAAVLGSHIFLAGTLLNEFGSPLQKKRHLHRLATGKDLGAFAFIEADHARINMSAVQEKNGYILNGRKSFVTNGGEADLYLVFARTSETNIGAFLVRQDQPGLFFGNMEEQLGTRAFPLTEITLQNCHVPVENLLGNKEDGWLIACQALWQGRMGIAAQAIGIAQAALEEAIAYAKERKQFGKPIADHQAILFKLAEMGTKVEAARLMTYRSAWCKREKLAYTEMAALSTKLAVNAAVEVTTEAVQIFGGYGYMQEYPVERYMRDAKMTQIFENMVNDIGKFCEQEKGYREGWTELEDM